MAKKVSEEKTPKTKKVSETHKKTTKKTKSSDIKKLKLLVTIVNRSRTLLYVDVIEQFEVNMQMVIYGILQQMLK